MSGFQLVASLVGSLAWPVAVVVAVWVLRRSLAAALGRAKRVEAAGVAVELAEVEQARESVEEELAQADAEGASLEAPEVDELVQKAAQLGWHLAKLGPGTTPDVVVDRSGGKPVVRLRAEERFRRWLAFNAVAQRQRPPLWVAMHNQRRPSE
ncbi:hypothetical protein [Nonomuraea cavernae]|uniref:Uncharacterized protein n=1 Tax=Nonomuraea cavernae TaxID=2045107 RepID=A0A918DG53_9ACTN|nr:hypothetical protein [Nonomuraea cavernae]MCA2184664.1 hypothetical protein [Nonomuraea cavernae]GGO63131.1 hypothetical protein GCM10012289_09340 [Nonomuraea cavernae]